MKNITKNFFFVILLLWICTLVVGCSHLEGTAEKGPRAGEISQDHDKPELTGRFASEDIKESSGVAASQCNAGVLWTVNDSGDGSFLYAFDESGKHLGTWDVPNASNKDWEALGSRKDDTGACFIYIGEIGNNKLERAEGVVYRIPEPAVTGDGASSTKNQPKESAPAEKFAFVYPDERHNAEALLVEPQSGAVYIITKTEAGPAGVYKLLPAFGSGTVTAVKVADLSLPAIPNGIVTGGEFAPDGKSLVISDYFAGYELKLPANAVSVDEIWSQKPAVIDIGKRKVGEAVTYSPDGSAIISTSEGKDGTIYRIRRKQK